MFFTGLEYDGYELSEYDGYELSFYETYMLEYTFKDNISEILT